jgi:hypothetical protein
MHKVNESCHVLGLVCRGLYSILVSRNVAPVGCNTLKPPCRDLSKEKLSRHTLVFTSGVIYGEDHRVLRTEQLQAEGDEVVATRRMWKGDRILTKKEIRLASLDVRTRLAYGTRWAGLAYNARL